jgi:hypothetical protein
MKVVGCAEMGSRQSSWQPSCVRRHLVDLVMPNMDGVQATLDPAKSCRSQDPDPDQLCRKPPGFLGDQGWRLVT